MLTRQKVPFLGDRDADVARGAYVIDGRGRQARRHPHRDRSEVSLALDAAKLLEAGGTKTRVVSMPCWELFERQDQAYRDAVLPPAVKARVSIEAGATLGWSRWVGDRGVALGIDHFGASAPAAGARRRRSGLPPNTSPTASGLLAAH